MLKAKKVSTLGLIITAIIVAEALIFMPSSSIKESNPSQTVLPASDANLSIEGFHAVNLNQEGRKETIDAEEAELYREKGFALLKKVEARIFGQGDDVIHIKGQEGKYYLDKKDIEFFGDIIATSENQGYQLKTNTLKYLDMEKLLSTDDPVWIAGPNPHNPSLEVTGVGLRANTKTEQFSILKEVRSRKHDVGAPSIDIDSDTVDVYSKKNEALFKDNVVVIQKEMNLFTDNFLINYNSRNKAIDKAKAYNQVKIVQGTRIATCQKAFLLNREQKMVLTGNPKVIQGNDTVTGKIVIFFMGENKILFDEAVGEIKGIGEENMKDFK
ncbi:MAG: LPS export ABC transporter periplasmic protein LptC [Deltaproteobacteria bacterium GWA2_38_16]|nr:MAG: LPS export ABC transporter periplasmic protein LptC [Deltaproteobacteria bacterium GWA2_38_16]HBQ21261.1 LPS export ABC transporter periplasmic protein LptC [Deltaproteobacteria bacterium]